MRKEKKYLEKPNAKDPLVNQARLLKILRKRSTKDGLANIVNVNLRFNAVLLGKDLIICVV